MSYTLCDAVVPDQSVQLPRFPEQQQYLTAEELLRLESAYRAIDKKPLNNLNWQETELLQATGHILMAGLLASRQSDAPEREARVTHSTQEARSRWLAAARTLLRKQGCSRTPTRFGKRLDIKVPDLLQMATANPIKDTVVSMGGNVVPWTEAEDGEGLVASCGETRLRLDYDELFDLGAETALRSIAKQGPALVQTLLALACLWLEQNRGKSHETYLTACASDVLRYQGRGEKENGGYARDDTEEKGRQVYLLSRINIVRGEVRRYTSVGNGKRGKESIETKRIGPLIVLKELQCERHESSVGNLKSVISFRYHLNEQLYEWLCGTEQPQFTKVSGRLLRYHPVRQKYHILLGFCLAYYSRVNQSYNHSKLNIKLPSLLKLAALDVPALNVPDFLASLRTAFADLAKDGVIPGLIVDIPENSSLSAREQIVGGALEYPPLPTVRRRAEQAGKTNTKVKPSPQPAKTLP